MEAQKTEQYIIKYNWNRYIHCTRKVLYSPANEKFPKFIKTVDFHLHLSYNMYVGT